MDKVSIAKLRLSDLEKTERKALRKLDIRGISKSEWRASRHCGSQCVRQLS